MFWSTAYAQAASPAAQPSFFEMFMPFIFIFVIFYFLIIRPQAKRQKEHQKFLADLKRGDEVVTASGIFGRIDGITDTAVTLEIADGVKIKVLRSQVAGSQKAATQPETKK
ncbi:MAG: preprotein translocase subunit YajC [Bdellovibrionia bacterium]